MKSNAILILLVVFMSPLARADWFDFFRTVPDHAVYPGYINDLTCRSPENNSKRNYFEKFMVGETSGQITINGKEFFSEYNQMINLYRTLTGFRNYRFDSRCSRIQCEIKSLFGESYAEKLSILLSEYNFNASFYAHKKGSAFSEKELDIIIWSLKQLPSFVFNNRIRLLIKDTTDFDGFYENVAGFTEDSTGNITFFNKWVKSSQEIQIYTVIHEYGHLIGKLLSLDMSQKWMNFSNWNHFDLNEENDSRQIITKYGRGNSREDFAESFSAYRLNPSLLRKNSPEKYKFLKSIVFLGIDYEKENCESSDVKKAISLSNINSEKINTICKIPIMSYMLNLKPMGKAVDCMGENADTIEVKSFSSQMKDYHSEINKNFTMQSYPWINKQLQSLYIENIEDSLEREYDRFHY